jgi:hypothetical protein
MSKIPSNQGKTTGATINTIPTIMAIIPIISCLVFEFMYYIMFRQLYNFNEKINKTLFYQLNCIRRD